jgi:hypothetical protein
MDCWLCHQLVCVRVNVCLETMRSTKPTITYKQLVGSCLDSPNTQIHQHGVGLGR